MALHNMTVDFLNYKINKLKKEIDSIKYEYSKYLEDNPEIIEKLEVVRRNMICYHQNKILCDIISEMVNSVEHNLIIDGHNKTKKINNSEQPQFYFDKSIITYIESISNTQQQEFSRAYYYHFAMADSYLQAGMSALSKIEDKLPKAYKLGNKVMKKTHKHNKYVNIYNNIIPMDFGNYDKPIEKGLSEDESFKLISNLDTYTQQLARKNLTSDKMQLANLRYSKEKFFSKMDYIKRTMEQ